MVVPEVLVGLPDSDELKHRSQVLAVADVICSFNGLSAREGNDPFEFLRFRFLDEWSGLDSVATFHSGTDDGFAIFFTPLGTYIKGFDHESEMSTAGDGTGPWPGLLETLPEWCTFYAVSPESQFDLVYRHRDGSTEPLMTLGLWRATGDTQWKHGDFPYGASDGDFGDGASWLLGPLINWSAEALTTYFSDYWGSPTGDLTAWSRLLGRAPLSRNLVGSLSTNAEWGSVVEQAGIIGYPVEQR